MNSTPATSAIRRRFRWWLRGGMAAGAFFALGWWGLPWLVPLPESLLTPRDVSPVFLARDGSPLRQLLTQDGQRVGPPTPFAQLPPHLIHATLAAEDKRFFSHGGVDLLAVLRSARDNLLHRRVVSGASTLTQQLVKVSADQRRSRNLLTKALEALQARRLEMTWAKDQILPEYLHRVSYGNLLTGCETAAQGYFNKPLRDLTPAECAFLASLPQAPTRLNPFKNQTALRKRQQHVLRKMREAGWLTEEALELALTEPLKLQRGTGGFDAPHAVNLLLAQGPAGTPPPQEIRTTIDPTLQRRVEGILQHRLNLLEGKHVTQAAAVVLENRTGRVLALAGSRDFFGTHSGQINGAWTPLSPGSALKPFTYLLGLERGLTPATVIPDLAIEYQTSTGLYRPENYDRRLHGPVTLRTALGSSLNIPAVKVLDQVGGAAVLRDTLEGAGLTTLTEPADHYGLGLTIGNAPVRLLELTNAYATLARLGEHLPWTLVDAAPSPGPPTRLFQSAPCFLIADILADNQARVLTFGPHSVIRLPFACAVKTGTSTSYRDNWTLGYTPEYTVGVWVGNFDNTPMNRVSGVTGAGPIFRDIFTHLHDSRGTTWYTAPADLQRARVDPRNGRRVTPQTPPLAMSREEWFLPGSLPPAALDGDYETGTGKAYLPPSYGPWATQEGHWLSGMVTIRPEEPEAAPLRILTPLDGAVFYLDPDLTSGGSRLLLEGTSPGLTWTSPTLAVEDDRGLPYARLTLGLHVLEARRPGSSEAARVRIEVRPPPTTLPGRSGLRPVAGSQPGLPTGQQPQRDDQRP